MGVTLAAPRHPHPPALPIPSSVRPVVGAIDAILVGVPPAPVVVQSASNPLVKRIRRLADRKHRVRERAFVVEGVQPVERALRSGAPVEVLIVAPELLTGPGAAATIQAALDAQVPVVHLTAELFTRLSDREGPTGVAAIVAIDERPLEQLVVGERSLFVALHEVANPGNLGTIVRTADSLGIDGVVVVGPSADPYSPSAVKASMGSLFAVPVVHAAAIADLLSWARAAHLSVVTTSARAHSVLDDVAVELPAVVLLGNEGAGLAPDVLAAGDVDVRIPMLGSASSLNLAVAAGIILYAAARRKRMD